MPRTKGALTLEDHIEFAKLLREMTGGKIVMNSLVLFLKRNKQSYEDFMVKQLELFQKIIDAGIHPELAPVRISSKSPLRRDPATNFVYYMIQHLVVLEMVAQAHLKPSFGCISCDKCHQYPEAMKFLHISRKDKINLPELFDMVLQQVGANYARTVKEIFSRRMHI